VSGAGPLLSLRGVHKAYPSGDGPALEVLRGVDLELARGEMLAITGPSGSGKSTLLNIIGALDRADRGAVLFEGRELGAISSTERREFRLRTMGFVFQTHLLLPYLTVLENALVPSLLTRDGGAPERARALLERVGLGHRLDHRPGALSGGERQRVALVRALVNRPRLVLADEPTGSLDREGSERLADLLVELNLQEGATLVLVTHSDALAGRAQRVLQLLDGTLSPSSRA
jgi:lipoprotein-releasing system ATP-binding protein